MEVTILLLLGLPQDISKGAVLGIGKFPQELAWCVDLASGAILKFHT